MLVKMVSLWIGRHLGRMVSCYSCWSRHRLLRTLVDLNYFSVCLQISTQGVLLSQFHYHHSIAHDRDSSLGRPRWRPLDPPSLPDLGASEAERSFASKSNFKF